MQLVPLYSSGVALLRELFEYGGVEVSEWVNLGEDEDVEVSGIANDSRVVLGGDVFVCIKGAAADGHDFALDAIAAGAVAIVCSEPIPGLSEDTPQVIVPDTSAALPRIAAAFYGNPSTALTTVGVTGTNGKTTTTYIVRSILEAADMPCGVIGTVGYELNDVKLTPHGGVWEPEERDTTADRKATSPGWLAPYKGKYEVPNTTPDALQCQQLLAGMLDNGAAAAAMEVSSHALAQGRVDCTDFDVAVFTNLSHDHLDFHGSMDNYREAKALLFRGLTDPERQRAVINLDAARDPADANDEEDKLAMEQLAKDEGKEGGEDMEVDFDNAAYFIEAAGGGERVPIITYATHMDKADEADVFVESAKLTLFETLVTIRTPVGSFDAVCGLIGKINVTNIAAAVAVGVALEIPLDVIAAGLEAMEPVPGRMELVDEGQPFPVVVDYAHTPDALRRAIESVRKTGAANVITVFGCGGDRDPKKRAEMGRIADKFSDIVFVTNDNPRTEDPYKILDDVVAGFRDRVYNMENIKEEAMFPFLKDMYLIHPNARHETMKLQNMCRRYVIVDRYFAIRAAVAMAGEEDAVLICGKGHEDYIVVGQKKHWFDDRVEARDALQKIVRVQESGIDTFNLPWGRPGAAASGNGNVLDA
jgi:UDP-N-acetylmuramyl-tripeptide synthetase